MHEVVEAPRRLDRELRQPAKRQPEGNREAGSQVPFPIAPRYAVDSQHHDLNARLLRTLHHGAVEAPILVEIELVDLGSVVGLPQLFEADGTERRDAEHRSKLRRRGRNGALPLMMEQTLQGRRRAIERRREPLTHDSDAEIDRVDAPQDIGNEVAGFEARRIAAVGGLIVGGAIDIIENRARQPRSCEPPKIVEIVTVPRDACVSLYARTG